MTPAAQRERHTVVAKLRADVGLSLKELEERVIVRDARARDQALAHWGTALAVEARRLTAQETEVLRRGLWGRLRWLWLGR